MTPTTVPTQVQLELKKLLDEMDGNAMFMPPKQVLPVDGIFLWEAADNVKFVFDSQSNTLWKLEWFLFG